MRINSFFPDELVELRVVQWCVRHQGDVTAGSKWANNVGLHFQSLPNLPTISSGKIFLITLQYTLAQLRISACDMEENETPSLR